MSDIARNIRARRQVEDRALALGNDRRRFEAALAANTQAIVELLRDAGDVAVPLDHLARMLGVSRQTLHRWRRAGAGGE